MDISFEFRIFRHLLCFPQDGVMTSRLHDTPLMKRQRTETAAAKAPAAARQTELNFLNRRYTALLFVTRMVGSHIRVIVNVIHFLHRKRFGRWILHNKNFSRIALDQCFCRKRIRIFVLLHKTLGVFFLLSHRLLEIRKFHAVINLCALFRAVDRSCDIRNIFHIHATRQCIGDFQHTMFSHSIRDKICPRIKQNGPFHLI